MHALILWWLQPFRYVCVSPTDKINFDVCVPKLREMFHQHLGTRLQPHLYIQPLYSDSRCLPRSLLVCRCHTHIHTRASRKFVAHPSRSSRRSRFAPLLAKLNIQESRIGFVRSTGNPLVASSQPFLPAFSQKLITISPGRYRQNFRGYISSVGAN